MADERKKLVRLLEASRVFTPTAPIHEVALFAGRREQIMSLFTAIGQRGQHALLYGERGVGKTSLANLIGEIFGAATKEDVETARVTCNSSSTYASIWQSVLKRDEPTLEEHEVTPERVLDLLTEADAPRLIVIDELDRFDDSIGLSLLADTVKALSDAGSPVTVILVGVGDSVMQLIGDHKSVRRALVQVQMPRMSLGELENILERGLPRLNLKMAETARRRVARLAQGLPSYAHLLAHFATMRAIESDRDDVLMEDVDFAIKRTVEKDQYSLMADYSHAIRSPRKDNLYAEVLLACALAEKNPLGHFSAGNVRKPLRAILKRDEIEISAFSRHLKEFASDKRNNVLEQSGEPHRLFYRFSEPAMQPYVIMKAIADGVITEDRVDELRDPGPPEMFPDTI